MPAMHNRCNDIVHIFGFRLCFRVQTIVCYKHKRMPVQSGCFGASGNIAADNDLCVCVWVCVAAKYCLWCSEMAPPHLRGRFTQLYQIILTLFILVAQVLNLIINLTNAVRWGWRLSLGFAFVPSTVLFLGGIFLPDSPNSLLERGHHEQVSDKLLGLRTCVSWCLTKEIECVRLSRVTLKVL